MKSTVKTIVLFCTMSFFGTLNAQEALRDMVNVEGNYVFYYEDQMDASFYYAMGDFLDFDRHKAAEEIAKAEGYVWYFENCAKEKDKPALREVAYKLHALSKKLDKDTIVYLSDLKKEFYETHHAMASYHYARAVELWAQKETKQTGQAMELAAKNINHAAAWSGKEVAAGAKATWKGTREVGWALTKGTGVGTEAVGKAIVFLGEELKKLGDKIKS